MLAASLMWLCGGGEELEENFELKLDIHEFRLWLAMGLTAEPLPVFMLGDVAPVNGSLRSLISGPAFFDFGV